MTNFQAIPGHGVSASVEGAEIQVGGPALLKKLGLSPEPALQEAAERAATRGQSAIYLVEGNRVEAVFAVADAIREESRAAIAELHESGIRVAMMTGDTRAVADAVARELGIDTVLAEVLPDQKAQQIKLLQADGSESPWSAMA